jgi:hypothetical protein
MYLRTFQQMRDVWTLRIEFLDTQIACITQHNDYAQIRRGRELMFPGLVKMPGGCRPKFDSASMREHLYSNQIRRQGESCRCVLGKSITAKTFLVPYVNKTTFPVKLISISVCVLIIELVHLHSDFDGARPKRAK